MDPDKRLELNDPTDKRHVLFHIDFDTFDRRYRKRDAMDLRRLILRPDRMADTSLSTQHNVASNFDPPNNVVLVDI